MGLDAFETGAHDAVRGKSKTSQRSTSDAVHKLKGTNVDTEDVPSRFEVHEVERRELIVKPGPDGMSVHFTCTDCNTTATSIEAILKVDKLEYRDEDWYPAFMQQVLEEADDVEREEMLNDAILEQEQEEEEDDDDSVEPSDDGGLMSFKS